MLKPFIPSKFVERIITSQTGECYRVVFVLTLVNGEVKAKAISAELIGAPTLRLAPVGTADLSDFYASDASNLSDASNVNLGILCLPCESSLISSFATFVASFAPKVSPFTSLLFFTSQPTRAPSF